MESSCTTTSTSLLAGCTEFNVTGSNNVASDCREKVIGQRERTADSRDTTVEYQESTECNRERTEDNSEPLIYIGNLQFILTQIHPLIYISLRMISTLIISANDFS